VYKAISIGQLSAFPSQSSTHAPHPVSPPAPALSLPYRPPRPHPHPAPTPACPPRAAALASSSADGRIFCYCLSHTDDGEHPRQLVFRSAWYAHKQPEKRRRLAARGRGRGSLNEGRGSFAGSPAGAGVSTDEGIGPGAETGSGAGVRAGAASAGTNLADARRRCDAEDTPNPSDESSGPSLDEDSKELDGEPRTEPITDSGLEEVVEPPPYPIYQPDVRTNEERLPVGQSKQYSADLALHALTVRQDLAQPSIADLLRLITCGAKYRRPYLMERLIDNSVNVETRLVDCCINGCVAFTHTRAQHATCTACNTARYNADEKPVKQITYRSLIAWLAHPLGESVIAKSMMESMAAARAAVDEETDGVHDYPHG